MQETCSELNSPTSPSQPDTWKKKSWQPENPQPFDLKILSNNNKQLTQIKNERIVQSYVSVIAAMNEDTVIGQNTRRMPAVYNRKCRRKGFVSEQPSCVGNRSISCMVAECSLSRSSLAPKVKCKLCYIRSLTIQRGSISQDTQHVHLQYEQECWQGITTNANQETMFQIVTGHSKTKCCCKHHNVRSSDVIPPKR